MAQLVNNGFNKHINSFELTSTATLQDQIIPFLQLPLKWTWWKLWWPNDQNKVSADQNDQNKVLVEPRAAKLPIQTSFEWNLWNSNSRSIKIYDLRITIGMDIGILNELRTENSLKKHVFSPFTNSQSYPNMDTMFATSCWRVFYRKYTKYLKIYWRKSWKISEAILKKIIKKYLRL